MYDVLKLPQEYLKHFPTWGRLEPRSRSADHLREGLEARVADPLWFLTRQWQMGEFKAEDNGSPLSVTVDHEVARIKAAEIGGKVVDLAKLEVPPLTAPPLEALVERETLPLEGNWRSRLQVGQQFERLLRAKLGASVRPVLEAYRDGALYGLAMPEGQSLCRLDADTERFVRLVAGRVIDGHKIIQLWPERSPVQARGISTEDHKKVILSFGALVAWYATLYGPIGEGAAAGWNGRQFEYEFRLTAGSAATQPVLDAPEYRNGDLDWYAADLSVSDVSLVKGEVQRSTFGNPVRVGFKGKPNERWWAFEDANVNLARLEPSLTEQGKLLLAEFALVYADDWFIVPLEVPVGSLLKVTKVTVVNTFDEPPFEIDPAIDDAQEALNRWELFTLARSDDRTGRTCPGVLFVPPSVGERSESAPLEEVRFLRDEGANMVFAVEKQVRNGLGKPVDGFDAQLERKQRQASARTRDAADAAQGAPVPAIPRYRFAASVPDNWIPFVPVRFGISGSQIVLGRAAMLRNDADFTPSPVTPMTTVLEKLGVVNEEAVPRAGVKVQLTAQRTRWIDGQTYVWYGRKTATGRGEGASGLKFDYLTDKPVGD